MSFYLWIIIGTIAGPFLLSFDRKVHFYTYWKWVAAAVIPVGACFLVWDAYFTQNKIWGFNPQYLQGIYLGNLPMEECLFFLVVPYACLFIHEVLKAYFPGVGMKRIAHYFAFAFTLAGLIFGISSMEQWYTASACIISAMLTIGFYFVRREEWYADFVFTFLVALVPFLIVNGLLTGGFTPEPVVWYAETHIMGLRIFTIPLEDVFYNYCMLLPVVGIFEWLKRKRT